LNLKQFSSSGNPQKNFSDLKIVPNVSFKLSYLVIQFDQKSFTNNSMEHKSSLNN